jgi:hypothetical protein
MCDTKLMTYLTITCTNLFSHGIADVILDSTN